MATFRTDILEKKALCLFLWSENVRNFQIKRKGWHGGFHAFVVLYITVTSRAARRHLKQIMVHFKIKDAIPCEERKARNLHEDLFIYELT